MISREPVIINLLKQRQPLLPRPFREDILIRAELIARKLRDPEFFANCTASTILSLTFSRLLGLIG